MVEINSSLCTGCGICKENCAVHAIVLNEDGTCRCNKTWCFGCGQCVAVCPTGATAMPGLEAPVEFDPASFELDPRVLLNAMRFRRSIRRFSGEKASRKELEMLLTPGGAPLPALTARALGLPSWTGSLRRCGLKSGKLSPGWRRIMGGSCSIGGMKIIWPAPASRIPCFTAEIK